MRGMVIGTVVFMVVGALLHVCGAGERYVYVRDGVVVCEPRGLPSVGVDRTTGQVVAGLHGASDGVKAGCGWYRVVASLQVAGSNEVVVGTSYVVQRDTVRAVHTYGVRRVVTLEERARGLFESGELAGLDDDTRASRVVQALAAAVTNRLSTPVVITVPGAADKGEVGVGPGPVWRRRE